VGGCGTCGGLNQTCCGGTNDGFCTGSHLACGNFPNYKCTPCGLPGEVCCDGNACAGDGCCVDGSCYGAGQACGFPVTGGTCDAKACDQGLVPCGTLGEPACGNTVCTQAYTVEQGLECIPCGGNGQPCCGAGSDAPCGPGFICNILTCTPCGGSGQSCCRDGSCRTGGCSTTFTCP
jgi:hypothetical protein